MPSKSSEPFRTRQYIQDMLNAIGRIQDYTAGMDDTEFTQDRKTYDAVVRNLEIIGEASRFIPPALSAMYTAAPWRVLGDLRNKAIHDYNGLSPLRIFRTAQDDLPGLKAAVDLMLASLPPDPDA